MTETTWTPTHRHRKTGEPVEVYLIVDGNAHYWCLHKGGKFGGSDSLRDFDKIYEPIPGAHQPIPKYSVKVGGQLYLMEVGQSLAPLPPSPKLEQIREAVAQTLWSGMASSSIMDRTDAILDTLRKLGALKETPP